MASTLGRHGRSVGLGGASRQPNGEARPSEFGLGHFDGSVVAVDYFAADAEANALSGRVVGAHPALQDALAQRLGNAGAIVAQADP